MAGIVFSVFTKPWQTMPIEQLAESVRAMGFDGIEPPVRPGYQVQPETIGKLLPGAVRAMKAAGVRIFSIAGNTDEETIAACGECGVPMIRTMARIPDGVSYPDAEAALQREYGALVPALEKHKVTIGVQNHVGPFVSSALGLARLLQPLDGRHVAAVWDAAHEALAGGQPQYALDVIWPRLCMVNLKNVMYVRSNGPEAQVAAWQHHWTSGRHGLASWPVVVSELTKRAYRGVICLTAEYSSGEATRLAPEDLLFARSLFG